MSDDINRVIADTMAEHSKILGYRCRDCGKEFISGRDGRKHMFSEHDDPLGLDKVKEAEA